MDCRHWGYFKSRTHPPHSCVCGSLANHVGTTIVFANARPVSTLCRVHVRAQTGTRSSLSNVLVWGERLVFCHHSHWEGSFDTHRPNRTRTCTIIYNTTVQSMWYKQSKEVEQFFRQFLQIKVQLILLALYFLEKNWRRYRQILLHFSKVAALSQRNNSLNLDVDPGQQNCPGRHLNSAFKCIFLLAFIPSVQDPNQNHPGW